MFGITKQKKITKQKNNILEQICVGVKSMLSWRAPIVLWTWKKYISRPTLLVFLTHTVVYNDNLRAHAHTPSPQSSWFSKIARLSLIIRPFFSFAMTDCHQKKFLEQKHKNLCFLTLLFLMIMVLSEICLL